MSADNLFSRGMLHTAAATNPPRGTVTIAAISSTGQRLLMVARLEGCVDHMRIRQRHMGNDTVMTNPASLRSHAEVKAREVMKQFMKCLKVFVLSISVIRNQTQARNQNSPPT
jgi:hypothetical protein